MECKKRNCTFNDTAFCNGLANKSGCAVKELDLEGQDDAVACARVMQEYLQEIRQDNGECALCKQAHLKGQGYLVIDFINGQVLESKACKKAAAKTKLAGFYSANVPVCSKCRNSFRAAENIRWIAVSSVLILAIVLLGITSVRESMVGVSTVLPPLFLIGMAFIGWLLGDGLRALYMKRLWHSTEFELLCLPMLVELNEKGWQPAFIQRGKPRVLYSDTPMPNLVDVLQKTN